MTLEHAYTLGLRAAESLGLAGQVEDLLTHEELMAYRRGYAACIRSIVNAADETRLAPPVERLYLHALIAP